MNISFRWATSIAVAVGTFTGAAQAQTFAPVSSPNVSASQARQPGYFAPASHRAWGPYHGPQLTAGMPGAYPASHLHDPYSGLSSLDGYSVRGSDCTDGTCGPPLLAPCDARCGWFGAASGLVMTRDQDNYLPFSYDTNDESLQLVTNRDADFDCAGGVETRIGRYFCCGQSSLEFVFWTIVPGSQSYQLLGADVAGNLNGIYNWDNLTYNGANADTFVDNAVVHRIERDFEFQNYEINWNNYLVPAGHGSWQVQSTAGFRIFRFSETLDFAADATNATFTGAANEIHYNIDVDNHLYGFQLGGLSEYRFNPRWSVTTQLLAGIYANDVQHHSRIGGSAGDAVVNNGPNNGQAFNVSGGDTTLALMGELDFGLMFRPTSHWQISGGYRAMGVSGIALASNQLYHDLRGIEDVEEIEVNGDLILHGGYFQLSYNY